MLSPCLTDELVIVERVRFPAGRHMLEGELAYAGTGTPAGAVLLAGPHPLLGGTLHNNVVRGLGDGLATKELATLRFNYRGVDGSEGPAVGAADLAAFWRESRVPAEDDYGEDLRSAATFLLSAAGPDMPLALVGYSFGCTLLPAAIPANRSSVLVLIAPTVDSHDLDAVAGLSQPKLVIAPRGDFAAEEGRLAEWLTRLTPPRELLRPRLDGHFFRGHEDWLVGAVSGFLDRQWRVR
jgi:uncharacterized protein